MTLHQINQDEAGPFTAMVDGTPGGQDVAAFQKATVTKNMPGIAAGSSTATVSPLEFFLDHTIDDGGPDIIFYTEYGFPGPDADACWNDMQWSSWRCKQCLRS
jgi:hypothetical protein